MNPTTATDPHRYLEDAADPRTIAWTAAQNARTRAAFDASPGRAGLVARLEALLAVDVQGVPAARGERSFFSARRGRADQASLYVRSGAQERVLLDPATLDPAGLVTIDWWYASPSGALVAFGSSRNGDERSTLHVLDVATGERLSEAIPDTRYCSLAWYPDERGFYYTRYPPGGEYDVRVYRHALGDAPERDACIFGEGRKREDMLALELSANGRYLVVNVHDGWARSDAYVADTAVFPPHFAPIAEGRAAIFDVRVSDATLFVRTNEGAPRFRVFAVSPQALDRDAWREIVTEGDGALDAIAVSRDALVLHYLEDVRSVVRIRRGDGRFETLDFGARSVLAIATDERSPDAYVQLASFLIAPEIMRVSLAADPATRATWERIAAPLDAGAYRVEQRWYASKDGTRIPMYVVARNDVAFDGTAPAVLYTDTAASTFRSSLRSHRVSCRGSMPAASMPSQICAAAANSAKTGIGPACANASKTSSTTSSRRPGISPGPGSRMPRASRSWAAATAAYSSPRSRRSGPNSRGPSCVWCRSPICCAFTSS